MHLCLAVSGVIWVPPIPPPPAGLAPGGPPVAPVAAVGGAEDTGGLGVVGRGAGVLEAAVSTEAGGALTRATDRTMWGLLTDETTLVATLEAVGAPALGPTLTIWYCPVSVLTSR